METVLKVEKLNKWYKQTQVLHDISFEVRKGEIMAILGPNGAGKSTAIRSILGIVVPDEGTITFRNQKAIPRQKIGYLPEERGLYKNVQVMDMLLYLSSLKDYPLDKAKARARRYLEKFGLADKEKASVEELSKGMGQKVQFIASVIHEPELLILDEPFSGLDPVSQELFKGEIRALAEQGTAILLSSHQMNVVEELADRLFMIHRGRKVIDGPMKDVKREYANFKCTIRGDNDPRLLERLPEVQRVERKNDAFILYLSKQVQLSRWLKRLPDELLIEELTIDRISLYEIFLDIALEKHDGKKEGNVDA